MPTLTAEQARQRFARERVARLATVGAAADPAAGQPHLVPVVFALTTGDDGGSRDSGDTGGPGDTVVFAVDHKPKRSGRLRRLENIRANPAVCLLADGYDEDWDRLWWARADGTARVLPPSDRSAAADLYVRLLADKYREQYAGRPPRGPVVEITVSRWSGWRAT
ncbi:MAG: TIGR03668 family PPOX class F420-dependent oxidoreductase [Streptomyces sp.]|uniref:TIGR03668 family PPOX class F420-dependent oxidoreductase n=1 Tax=Streptomyces sp. TaxID=1931 RepID=UPI003D6A33EB